MTKQEALETLDLSEGAHQAEIVDSYEELIARYDPERASERLKGDYQARRQLVTEAYQTLMPSARAVVDQSRDTDDDRDEPIAASTPPSTTPGSTLAATKSNPLDIVSKVVPPATRNELLKHVGKLQSLESDRRSAALQRIYTEVDELLPRGAGGNASPIRNRIASDITLHVGECVRLQDRLLLFTILGMPVLPLCAATVAVTPGLVALVPLFGLASTACLAVAFFINLKMVSYMQSLPGIFLNMIRPYVKGNLDTAKSTEDLARIQELVSYSLLFIEDFGLSGEITQRETNRSVSYNNSTSSGGYSSGVSTSYSNLVGTLNPRVMKRLKRSVTYAEEALQNKSLTDYERDKVLDELHANIESATRTDPSEWARDVVTGAISESARQKTLATTRKAIMIFAGGFVAAGLGAALISSLGKLVPILIIVAAVGYVKRDAIKDLIAKK